MPTGNFPKHNFNPMLRYNLVRKVLQKKSDKTTERAYVLPDTMPFGFTLKHTEWNCSSGKSWVGERRPVLSAAAQNSTVNYLTSPFCC